MGPSGPYGTLKTEYLQEIVKKRQIHQKKSNSFLRLYHILHPIWTKLGTKVHMDVLKVHAEKKISGSNLNLTFGPLRGPLGAQKRRFGVFLVL